MGLRAGFGLVAVAVGSVSVARAAFADASAGPLPIEGPATCPTPGEVARRLRPLLGDGGIGQPGDRVRIDRDDQVLRVALVADDGRVRGVRQVDRQNDCDELAEAAAVIVASWQMQREPASGTTPPAIRAAAGPIVGPAVRSPTQIVGSADPLPAIEPTGPRWFVGLAVAGNAVAGSSDGAVAPALTLEANAAPRVNGLGLHLRAVGGARHSQGLPNGEARWRRWTLSLGPSWSWAAPHVVVEADLSAAAALLALDGVGFAGNESHEILDLGALAGVRARSRRGLCAFVGLGAGFWPRRTIAYQAPDLVGSALPRWQWLAEAGIGWDR